MLYAESAAKYAMLAERFRALARSTNRVAYLVKTADAEARTKAVALRDVPAPVADDPARPGIEDDGDIDEADGIAT